MFFFLNMGLTICFYSNGFMNGVFNGNITKQWDVMGYNGTNAM